MNIPSNAIPCATDAQIHDLTTQRMWALFRAFSGQIDRGKMQDLVADKRLQLPFWVQMMEVMRSLAFDRHILMEQIFELVTTVTCGFRPAQKTSSYFQQCLVPVQVIPDSGSRLLEEEPDLPPCKIDVFRLRRKMSGSGSCLAHILFEIEQRSTDWWRERLAMLNWVLPVGRIDELLHRHAAGEDVGIVRDRTDHFFFSNVFFGSSVSLFQLNLKFYAPRFELYHSQNGVSIGGYEAGDRFFIPHIEVPATTDPVA